MSKELINRNEDLQRLFKAGYEVQIINNDGYLLIHNVPYVNKERIVKKGILVSVLFQSGGRTIKPTDHVAWFVGEVPHTHEGKPFKLIVDHNTKVFSEDLESTNTLSAKADYQDHFEKMTRYVKLLSDHAKVIDPMAKAETFQVIEHEDEESVFEYPDTNSTRALISPITNKLKGQKIAIVGVGGTGSYILDLVAKTPVAEIHLYDGDNFLQHNAFRAPGATPKEKLYEHFRKTDYFKEIYSKMHKQIFSHPYYLNEENAVELSDKTFVFIAMDGCPEKKTIISVLEDNKIPFIDTGLGLQDIEGSLKGQVRVTTSVPGRRDHIYKRVSFVKRNEDLYDQNIQVADLNALNATFAVIKWKKLYGFYKDHDRELHSSYVIFTNEISNDEFQV